MRLAGGRVTAGRRYHSAGIQDSRLPRDEQSMLELAAKSMFDQALVTGKPIQIDLLSNRAVLARLKELK